MAAMVTAVGERGYRATTIADVIGRAGASRKTFYVHFANKQDCVLATYEQIATRAARRLEHAYRAAEGDTDRIETAIRALFDSAIENPGALRLATVEITAVGSAGMELREQSFVRYRQFIAEAALLEPGKGTMSDASARAVIGGLTRVLSHRITAGRRDELPDLVQDLASWGRCYYPTPPTIARTRRERRGPSPLGGGRAPGTLAPRLESATRRGLVRGKHPVSHSVVVHSQRERILDAVANLTAAKGYEAVGVEGIAREAAVSLHAFYQHFADQEDAFIVAYELGHTKGLSIVERAYAEQSEWPHAVRAGIEALFLFLASEPAFARIALVDALIATSRTAEHANAGVSAFARMLVPSPDAGPGYARPSAATIEAIAGGIFELCLQYAAEGRIQELPQLSREATYIALVPFLGAEEAQRVTSGRR
jgi:AcrR family transcriptional regulator